MYRVGQHAVVCFGVFEADLRTRELYKHGVRLKLPRQSFQVLQMLLEHPGELVTRDDLRHALWPADTFVDFDHGLNNAIKRIRDALDDSAETPRYIETLPRLGYRFIASINEVGGPLPEPVVQETRQSASHGARVPWRVVASVFGILLFAVIITNLLRHKSTPQSDTLAIVPFTTYPGNELYPSFSPDGNQIAFAWNGGENTPNDAFDLYVKQRGSEIPHPLTNRPAAWLAPAWSPDGRFIAFSRSAKGGDGIYIVPALGGPERKLAETRFTRWLFGALSWSPDGKWLAFRDADKQVISVPVTNINLLNLDTLERQILPHPSPDCSSSSAPAFSPDGEFLALACMVEMGVQRIYVRPVRKGLAREVARVGGNLEGLTWSVDSKSLLYSVDGQIWRVPLIDGKPEKLLFAQSAYAPAVAGRGNRMAYVQVIGGLFRLNIWRLDLASPTKPRYEARKLIASSRGQRAPCISPDGKHIAFESWSSGNPEIWAADSDGSNPVQLTSFGGPMTGTPRWSPDGRHLVFDSRASGVSQLYIVNADGGRLQRLQTGSETDSEPFWSKDGKWIYFRNDRNSGIWKVSAEGGSAIQLTKKPGAVPQESADGMRIFFGLQTANGAELWSASVNGGDERLVPDMPILNWAGEWAAAKKGIYFIDGRAEPATLNLLDTDTHRIHRILELKGAVQNWGMGLSISNDGSTLIYAQNERGSGDIMLVEGFR
jgi:Tol biopolymer transport system component/DNA-binding winged helix-turn-helix (wHTH) protein